MTQAHESATSKWDKTTVKMNQHLSGRYSPDPKKKKKKSHLSSVSCDVLRILANTAVKQTSLTI